MVERQGIRRYVAHLILWIGIAIVLFRVWHNVGNQSSGRVESRR